MSITHVGEPKGSQSLSSRAMSFDKETAKSLGYSSIVSIPFEQGDVFRPLMRKCNYNLKRRLNPFRAGRCLSTYMLKSIKMCRKLSQSLSSRAMSFDEVRRIVYRAVEASQSLSSRAMSFDKKFKMRFVFL